MKMEKPNKFIDDWMAIEDCTIKDAAHYAQKTGLSIKELVDMKYGEEPKKRKWVMPLVRIPTAIVLMLLAFVFEASESIIILFFMYAAVFALTL